MNQKSFIKLGFRFVGLSGEALNREGIVRVFLRQLRNRYTAKEWIRPHQNLIIDWFTFDCPFVVDSVRFQLRLLSAFLEVFFLFFRIFLRFAALRVRLAGLPQSLNTHLLISLIHFLPAGHGSSLNLLVREGWVHLLDLLPLTLHELMVSLCDSRRLWEGLRLRERLKARLFL